MEWDRVLDYIVFSLFGLCLILPFFASEIRDLILWIIKKRKNSGIRKEHKMPNDLEHERHRFSTMSRTQLRRRLSRITVFNKLLNFATVAREVGYNDLSDEALSRLYKLTGHVVTLNSVSPASKSKPQPTDNNPTIRKIRL
jgi:hypothetical protein